MKRIRVTIKHNPQHPSDDLRWAARLRRDLWTKFSSEFDPDSVAHMSHRDGDQNLSFEFATGHLPEVEHLLLIGPYRDWASVEVLQEGEGTECARCGNIMPHLLSVCPTCQYREIETCPYCHREVARLNYLPKGGDLFECPECGNRVRFRFQDDVFDDDGRIIEPVVVEPIILVSPAEVPALHGV